MEPEAEPFKEDSNLPGAPFQVSCQLPQVQHVWWACMRLDDPSPASVDLTLKPRIGELQPIFLASPMDMDPT